MKALIPGFDDLISVSEDEIAQAHIGLNRGGIYVEPTSAMVFAGLKREEKSNDSLNVLVFTGNGLKSSY
jgi:threonine synthase